MIGMTFEIELNAWDGSTYAWPNSLVLHGCSHFQTGRLSALGELQRNSD